MDQILLIELAVTEENIMFSDLIALDYLGIVEVQLPLLMFFFISDYQDLLVLLTYYNPELFTALNFYVQYY